MSLERFEGPHPAGTVGLHIHLLDPVSRGKRGMRTGAIVRRGTAATVVRGARGAVVCRSVIVNGVRVRRCM